MHPFIDKHATAPAARKQLSGLRRFGSFSVRAAFVALPVLAVTVFLYLGSGRSERLLVEAETARQADNASMQFRAFLDNHLNALKGIGNFASLATPSLPDEYTAYVARAMADTPGFDAILWVSANGVRSPVAPLGRSMTPVDPDGPIAGPAVRKALETHRPAGTNCYQIATGEAAITLAAPVYRSGRYDGIVIGAVRLNDAMGSLYSAEMRDFWNMEIRDRADHVAYRAASSAVGPASDRHVPVADRAWKLSLWPTPQFVSEMRTAAPQRILALGLLATLAVAVANYLLAQRQERLGESLRESTRLAADLAAAQRHLSQLVNGIEAVVWEGDLEMHRFTFISEYGWKMLGVRPGDRGSDPAFWYQHVHPDDRERALANSRGALEPGRTYPEEYRMITADERTLWVREMITVIDGDGAAKGRRGVIVDITARVQAEEAVRQSQKLESLGVLAGGIAHDFNNLLTTILGNAEMLGRQLGKDPAIARSYLDKVERTTRRLAELTRQMLAYSGRGKFTVVELDLNAIITEMTELLSVSTTKNVEVHYQLDYRLPTLEGDAAQIRQVVLNLLTNAAEAIGDQARGDVSIRTVECTLTTEEADAAFPGQELAAGKYAQLEVSDSGCGMTAETLSKIFDPFFTTKFTGRGLGLAALRGIVRSHRGGIRIFSQPGEGTVFTLVFPAAANPRLRHAEPGGVVRPARETEQPRRLQALLVDDEDGLRSLMADALRLEGFDVLEAADGQQGVSQFRRRADDIDVVVLDLTMPRMNGDEALAQITALRPNACVILCSGYTKEEVDRQFSGRRLAGFIEKPFTPSELIAKIKAVLMERQASAAQGAWPRDERRFSLNIGDASPGEAAS